MTSEGEVEVFSSQINSAVVRMPGRQYPGVVIQGDTLHTLLTMVQSLRAALRAGELEQASDDALMLEEDLSSHLGHYEAVLKASGLDLPYFSKGG